MFSLFDSMGTFKTSGPATRPPDGNTGLSPLREGDLEAATLLYNHTAEVTSLWGPESPYGGMTSCSLWLSIGRGDSSETQPDRGVTPVPVRIRK